MDPTTPLALCAACGVYEFCSTQLPLGPYGPDGEPALRLSPTIRVSLMLYDTALRLTPEQVQEHLARPFLYRDCYSVLRVRDAEHIISLRPGPDAPE